MAARTFTYTNTVTFGDGSLDFWYEYAVVVPLTTVFSPPAGCDTVFIDDYITTSATCAPPFFSFVGNGGGFYSPGFCPYHYSVGCQAPTSYLNDDMFGLTTKPGESVYLCVPSGFTCEGNNGANVARPTSPISKYAGGVRVIEIRWQESDLSILPADPLASSTSSSAQFPANTGGTTAVTTGQKITSTGETTAPGRSSVSSNSGNSNRLSPGVIAGICIGALLVLILAVGGVILWLRYRKKHLSQTPNAEPQVPQLDGQPVSEVGLTPAKGSETQNRVSQQQYLERHELDTEKGPSAVELPGERYVDPAAELHTVPVVNSSAMPQVVGERPRVITSESTPTPAPGPNAQGFFNEHSKHPFSHDQSQGQEIEELLKQQQKIQTRKQTLLEIQQLQEDEDRIEKSLEVLKKQNAGGGAS